MANIPNFEMKSGYSIPALGMGTWRLKGKECENAVRKALELGYTHIDTAEYYENHKEIKKAIKDFNREELFITSKIWFTNLHYEDTLKACNKTLEELGTDYLDLYLIHWPETNTDWTETFDAFKELHKAGKVKSIGISNFTISHIKEALKKTKIPIAMNQVEFHPKLYQKELLEFCRENGILITAYSPLGRTQILKDSTLVSLAEKYNKTPAQISLRWLLQKKIAVIPKAKSETHLQENMNLFDWEISKEDEFEIDSLGKNNRLVIPGFAEFDD